VNIWDVREPDGGPVETIEDGISGFLVEPGNPRAHAEKIDLLLENKEVAKKKENARKSVEENFSIEKMLEVLRKSTRPFYKSL